MSNNYIHGFSDSEQTRLSLMQTILNQRQLNAMDLSTSRRILDVGSGLGQFTRAMAHCAPSSETVVGIELSETQLRQAHQLAAEAGDLGAIEFRQGSAMHLPLTDDEWGSFDLVHSRFLLEHLNDPLPAVAQMLKAARIGGTLFIIDDDHELLRLSPECPSLQIVWNAYWNSYYQLPADPLVGRHLPSLLHQAGAQVQDVGTVFFGAAQGQEIFDVVVDNMIGVVKTGEDNMKKHQLITEQQWREAQTAVAAWRCLPDACLWYSIPYAIGIRP